MVRYLQTCGQNIIFETNYLMMKTRLLIISIFSLLVLAGQSQAIYTQADYNKTKKPALLSELPFSDNTVKDAILDHMKTKGYKQDKNKDYVVFKGVSLAELGPGQYDLYFKINEKSRKERDKSIVTMFISKGYENFAGADTEPDLINNGKTFLDSLINTAAAYDLELQIKSQDESVKKAERRLQDMMNDKSELEKKITRLQDELAQNAKNQIDQQTEIDKQKQILQTLITKRIIK